MKDFELTEDQQYYVDQYAHTGLVSRIAFLDGVFKKIPDNFAAIESFRNDQVMTVRAITFYAKDPESTAKIKYKFGKFECQGGSYTGQYLLDKHSA